MPVSQRLLSIALVTNGQQKEEHSGMAVYLLKRITQKILGS